MSDGTDMEKRWLKERNRARWKAWPRWQRVFEIEDDGEQWEKQAGTERCQNNAGRANDCDRELPLRPCQCNSILKPLFEYKPQILVIFHSESLLHLAELVSIDVFRTYQESFESWRVPFATSEALERYVQPC